MKAKASFSTRLPTNLIMKIKSGASQANMTIADYVESRLSRETSDVKMPAPSASGSAAALDAQFAAAAKSNELVMGRLKDDPQIGEILDYQQKTFGLLNSQVVSQKDLMSRVVELEAKLKSLQTSVEVPHNSHSAQLTDILFRLTDISDFVKKLVRNFKINAVLTIFTILSVCAMVALYRTFAS